MGLAGGVRSPAYTWARLSTRALFVAVVGSIVVLSVLCGGGSGPDPIGSDISEDDLYTAAAVCLPWFEIGLPTVAVGALTLRGPPAADRSGWFVATWSVFLVTPLAVAVWLGQVFLVMIALWLLGAAGLGLSLVATRRPRSGLEQVSRRRGGGQA